MDSNQISVVSGVSGAERFAESCGLSLNPVWRRVSRLHTLPAHSSNHFQVHDSVNHAAAAHFLEAYAQPRWLSEGEKVDPYSQLD